MDIYANLKKFHTQQCGAKHSLDIKPEFFDDAIAAGYSPDELKNVESIESKVFAEALLHMRKTDDPKDRLKLDRVVRGLQIDAWQAAFNDEKSGYSIRRVTQESIAEDKTLPNRLFLFKLEHAPFVGAAKIKQGLYSPFAEQRKIENENVREFVVEEKGEIIGTLMLTMHDSNQKVYAADFIVHSDKQNHHLGQAIIVKAAEELQKEFPHIETAWLISGGDGETPKGEHLYSKVVPLHIMNAAALRKAGMFVNFGTPGAIALTSAARDEKQVTLDPDIKKVFAESDLELAKKDLVAKYTRIFRKPSSIKLNEGDSLEVVPASLTI